MFRRMRHWKKETVKPIQADRLDRLILQFLGSSQRMEEITEELIMITSDGIVDEGELQQFDSVLAELEKMSVNIQSLMMWAKKNKDSIINKKRKLEMADKNIENEINKRRTFAIISHPDAGKTTLTEKFLFIWRCD